MTEEEKNKKVEPEVTKEETEKTVEETMELPKDKEKKKSFFTKENKNSLELEKLKKEVTASNEKVVRLSAEIQNMRRRYEDELSKKAMYEGSDLIKSLLPIIDNFERAIAMDNSENDKYLEGYKMIYTNMLTVLKNIGVTEIECLRKPFDPKFMDAVLTENILEEEQGVVLDVLQKGYMYKDKLLRPAMVKVNE